MPGDLHRASGQAEPAGGRLILRRAFWCAPAALPAALCDRALAAGAALDLQAAGMTDARDQSVRASRVAWLTERWAYEAALPFVARANAEAGWGFDYRIAQMIQFTAYGPGERYGWHTDQTPEPYGPEYGEYAGTIRKLSFSVQLSDPADYDGGRLEIERGVPGEPARVRALDEALPRGSVVVFPSFVPHRVTPVTRGARYALVGWVCGPPFV